MTFSRLVITGRNVTDDSIVLTPDGMYVSTRIHLSIPSIVRDSNSMSASLPSGREQGL